MVFQWMWDTKYLEYQHTKRHSYYGPHVAFKWKPGLITIYSGCNTSTLHIILG